MSGFVCVFVCMCVNKAHNLYLQIWILISLYMIFAVWSLQLLSTADFYLDHLYVILDIRFSRCKFYALHVFFFIYMNSIA